MSDAQVLYSYDIFDTVLTRAVYQPEGIFSIMQARMSSASGADHELMSVPSALKGDFCNIRHEYEKIARTMASKEEITLDDIYSLIAQNFSLTASQKQLLISLERETELACSLPIKATVQEILARLKAHEKVVFISDMYLDEQLVREMLVKASPEFAKVPLYLSSTCGFTKSSGRLFDYVKEQEHAAYDSWVHKGDNRHSDVKKPQELGIGTSPVEIPKLSGICRYLAQNMRDSVSCQVMLGCIKSAIQRNPDEKADFRYLTGATTAGPIFVSYVAYVLEQSVRLGIDNLYFLARDGYILKIIADALIEKDHLPIKTTYLYSSRDAWQSKDPHQQDLLKRYCRQEVAENGKIGFVDLWGTGWTVRKFADLCGIDLQRLCAFLFGTHKINLDLGFPRLMFIQHFKLNGHIEMLGKAPEGQCTGFTTDDTGKVIPVCREAETQAIAAYGFESYFHGVQEYLSSWLECGSLVSENSDDVYQVIKVLLTEYLFFPNDSQLRFYLTFPDYPRLSRSSTRTLPFRMLKYRLSSLKYRFKFIESSKTMHVFR